MKESDFKLSMTELEELCNLYMEGRLSVLEERELHYVLLKTEADSQLIRQTKTVMDIEQGLVHRAGAGLCRDKVVRKNLWLKRMAYSGVAAAVFAGLILFSVFSYHNDTVPDSTSGAGVAQGILKPGKPSEDEESLLTTKETQESINKEVLPAVIKKEKRVTEIPSASPAGRVTMPKLISENDTAGWDDYIVVEDSEEMRRIMEDIDSKLTATIYQCMEAERNIPDLNEIFCSVFDNIR